MVPNANVPLNLIALESWFGRGQGSANGSGRKHGLSGKCPPTAADEAKRCDVHPPALLHRAGEFRRRSLDGFAGTLQDFAYFDNLFAGQLPILLLNALAHRRPSLHVIAGIEARGLDLVLEPWAVGETLVQRQRALHRGQLVVGIFQRGPGQRRPVAPHGLSQRLVV